MSALKAVAVSVGIELAAGFVIVLVWLLGVWRLGIPMIYGIDAVHGNNNVYGATIFPHNVGLGATRDPDLVKRIGEATALEVRATGIQYAFAPCIAVN